MIDNVSIKQRIQQFDLKHGADEAVKSADGSFWLFPDGARRETYYLGLLDEPPDPDNEYEMRRLKRSREQVELLLLERLQEYHATRLARLTEDFQHRKSQMLHGHYKDQELAELQKLAKTVQVCRHQLGMVEAEIRQKSPRHKSQEMNAHLEQERQRRSSAVRGINI